MPPLTRDVGGVILPPVDYFAIVVLALFFLWVTYFLFRKMAPRFPGLIRFGSRHVDAMSLKPGPTQSGINNFTRAVGGVVLPTVNYLVLGMLTLFVLWIGFFLFRKRSSVIKFFAPMLLRLTRT
jgi:hypothetical protein